MILCRILERLAGGSINDIRRAARVELIPPHCSSTPLEHHSQEEGKDGCEDEFVSQTHSREYGVV